MTMKKRIQISTLNQQRLEYISTLLHEIRLAQGKNQDGFRDFGLSRRQIQRGEYSNNLTILSIFNLIDSFGYRVDEFFQGME
jgi:hypothetical protein